MSWLVLYILMCHGRCGLELWYGALYCAVLRYAGLSFRLRQVLGHRGKLPNVYIRISVKYHLLRRLLGSKAQEGDKSAKVSRLKAAEIIMANIGSTSTSAKVCFQ